MENLKPRLQRQKKTLPEAKKKRKSKNQSLKKLLTYQQLLVDNQGLPPSRLKLEQSSDNPSFGKISSCNHCNVKTSSKADLNIHIDKNNKIPSSKSETVYVWSLCDEHVKINLAFK